jgi:hypothetical protein
VVEFISGDAAKLKREDGETSANESDRQDASE